MKMTIQISHARCDERAINAPAVAWLCALTCAPVSPGMISMIKPKRCGVS